jgi:uncharacterized membrane protein YphA (DoxX/SURF4 family)
VLRTIVRRSGQALLGAMFVRVGFDAAREPGMRTRRAADLGVPLDPETAVRCNGAAMVAGGSALIIDVLPRLAAAGLVVSMIPTTLAGHAFWKHDHGPDRTAQQVQFAKNLGLIGGLLCIVATSAD